MARGVLRRLKNKAVKEAKKRYVTKTGKGLRMGAILKDVQYLKSLINTEKKSFTQAGNNSLVGQVNGNSSGHFLLDLTPVVGQGTGYQNRIGNSVKWSSGHLQFLFQTQSAVTRPIKLELFIVKVIGEPFSSMSSVMGKFISNNPFITDQVIFDTYCARETDYFKNYRVLRRKSITLNPSFSTERVVKDINLGYKLKEHHIKWSADTATVSEGQIFLLIVASCGNSSVSTANTSTSGGVPAQSVSTGVEMKYNFTQYFIDN